MYPNPNTYVGSLMSQALIANALYNNPTTGRFFIVAKAGVVNESEIKALYGSTTYPDGTPIIYTTLDAAVSACLASRGDTVLVVPGHTETISSATALLFDVAGVNIVGLGVGSSRPTFTLDTAATAKIPVSAANMSVQNCIFIANFADIATVFLLTTAPGFKVSSCEFRDTSSILNFISIITTTVAVVADGLSFISNKIMGLGTTAATTPIKILGTHDRLVINDNYINLAALDNTSCILAHGALVVTNLEMNRNKVFRLNTDSATGALLVTTSSTTNTGMICDNYVQHADVAAAVMVTSGCKYGMFNNLADGDANASGFVLPAIGVN